MEWKMLKAHYESENGFSTFFTHIYDSFSDMVMLDTVKIGELGNLGDLNFTNLGEFNFKNLDLNLIR